MCRHLGYVGPPVAVGELIARGPHSLYAQSWAPREMRRGGTINADGFGAAWWRRAEVGIDGAREAVTRYRNAAPIWTDPAVAEVLGQLESRAVLAAVRSATVGMPIERAACAPFVDEHWAFSHNGVVPDWRATLPLVLADLDEILTPAASPVPPRGIDGFDPDLPSEPLHTDPETAASVDSQGADSPVWHEPGLLSADRAQRRGGPPEQAGSSPDTAGSPTRNGSRDHSPQPPGDVARPPNRTGRPPKAAGRQDSPAVAPVFGSPAALLQAESLTDSAALWVLLRGLLGAITPDGPVRSPGDALSLLVDTVLRYQPSARLNLLLGNGAELWATTCWHSLSVLVADDYTVLSSEPYDDDPRWQPVDDHRLVIAGPGHCTVTALALPTTERVRS
ncbi:hypothetical protein NN3_31120 [Nocardia neocaledoniensis NBRC 108232]|uniref:Gamma-glutamyl-hercynylcysteine sulfoxide hydrolase n=1 Tax=Nocardia neocaledoniensis TaxID=236511 RepID=A0A317NBH7_9NOCA|nr:glutamine amidotransferase-like protein [Nocardia neocaledoniensis]GEM32105.1 hypothetical protein NN3_31120 [Nocardia neocaledoniensis NBRC 108232]